MPTFDSRVGGWNFKLLWVPQPRHITLHPPKHLSSILMWSPRSLWSSIKLADGRVENWQSEAPLISVTFVTDSDVLGYLAPAKFPIVEKQFPTEAMRYVYRVQRDTCHSFLILCPGCMSITSWHWLLLRDYLYPGWDTIHCTVETWNLHACQFLMLAPSETAIAIFVKLTTQIAEIFNQCSSHPFVYILFHRWVTWLDW